MSNYSDDDGRFDLAGLKMQLKNGCYNISNIRLFDPYWSNISHGVIIIFFFQYKLLRNYIIVMGSQFYLLP